MGGGGDGGGVGGSDGGGVGGSDGGGVGGGNNKALMSSSVLTLVEAKSTDFALKVHDDEELNL